LRLSGKPHQLGQQVAVESGTAALSVSDDGILAYRSGATDYGESGQAIWFSRSGNELERVGDSFIASLGWALSPNRNELALGRTVGTNTDLWLLETDRSAFIRLTSDKAYDANPTWSPDGQFIIFNRNAGSAVGNDLFTLTLNTRREELLYHSSQNVAPTDWSSDGRFLMYHTFDPGGGDLYVLPVTKDGRKSGEPIPVASSPFHERAGQFSPDGKWIAYESDRSGEPQIYVQPFPGPGPEIPVSKNGGQQVRWRHDGRELFYIGRDARLMAVTINVDTQPIKIDGAVPLFTTHLWSANSYRQTYSVSSDGQRFLMNVRQPFDSPVELILNPNLKSKP
jgi:Tol biopolymer transport system component